MSIIMTHILSAGDLLTKFGIESKDEELIISRERYGNYITPLIQGKANIKLSTRPKGRDLICSHWMIVFMKLKTLSMQNHIISYKTLCL